jgi:hypothetical protein
MLFLVKTFHKIVHFSCFDGTLFVNIQTKCNNMASLKKRGKNWSIIFTNRVDGKLLQKTYALGTKYKKVAKHKLTEYEKLYEKEEINPFDEYWNLKEYVNHANLPMFPSSQAAFI